MQPKVGVAVIVIREGKVLLGKRKNSHGDGQWAFPGGHLEFGEEIQDCAKRELLEETGLEVNRVVLGPYTNNVFGPDKHYITIFTIVKINSKDEPKLMEPEKCEQWQWFAWGQLPSPLFGSIASLLEAGWNLDKIKKIS